MTESTRICNKCGIEKPMSEFYLAHFNGVDMYRKWCKSCLQTTSASARQKRIETNTDEYIAEQDKLHPIKYCIGCSVNKPITEFNIRRDKLDGHDYYCKDCHKISNKNNHHAHKLNLSDDDYEAWRHHIADIARDEKQRVKLEVFTHYCNGELKCANPFHLHNEDVIDIDVLSIDHINGDGWKDLDKYGIRQGGIGLYRKLRRLKYPEGYQVLCMNCNVKKAKLNEEHSPSKWAHPFKKNPKWKRTDRKYEVTIPEIITNGIETPTT